MTEEIIVDGVNVAGCILLEKNNTNCICCGDDIREYSVPFANFCEENKDCYYKQLKRLEQENKELKNKNICRETCEYFKRICNENTLLINYRSALEEIRDYLNTLTTVDSDFVNTETYLRINDKIEEVLNS